jgi:prevent-host-death family protein
MCYMDQVGIRELRQNLTVYLRRVQRGETLEVTDRGHPVAVIGPLEAASSALDRNVQMGRVRPAASREPFQAPAGIPSTAGSDALATERTER